jgi:hypothetical protein
VKKCGGVSDVLTSGDPVGKAYACAMEKYNEISAAYQAEETRLTSEYATADAELETVASELAGMFSTRVVNVQRNAARAVNRRRRRRGRRRGNRPARLNRRRC